MTRERAISELRRLAFGLQPDLAGAMRLLERIAGHEEAELLRDSLVERGALALLDEEARR